MAGRFRGCGNSTPMNLKAAQKSRKFSSRNRQAVGLPPSTGTSTSCSLNAFCISRYQRCATGMCPSRSTLLRR